jgi:hypothetical protein
MQGENDEAELLGWSLKSLARKARKVSHKALKVGVQIPIVGDKVKLARTVLNKADKATGGRIGKGKSKSKSKVIVVKKDNERQRIKPERSRGSFDSKGRGKGKGKGLPMPLIIGGVGLGALLLLKKK